MSARYVAFPGRDGAVFVWLFSSQTVRLWYGAVRCRDGFVALRLRVRAVLVGVSPV